MKQEVQEGWEKFHHQLLPSGSGSSNPSPEPARFQESLSHQRRTRRNQSSSTVPPAPPAPSVPTAGTQLTLNLVPDSRWPISIFFYRPPNGPAGGRGSALGGGGGHDDKPTTVVFILAKQLLGFWRREEASGWRKWLQTENKQDSLSSSKHGLMLTES